MKTIQNMVVGSYVLKACVLLSALLLNHALPGKFITGKIVRLFFQPFLFRNW